MNSIDKTQNIANINNLFDSYNKFFVQDLIYNYFTEHSNFFSKFYTTDCFYNLMILGKIFSGNNANKMIFPLIRSYNYSIYLHFPNQTLTYQIRNVNTGFILKNLSDEISPSDDDLLNIIQEVSQPLLNHINKNLERHEIKEPSNAAFQVLQNLDFDFNIEVFNLFKGEINQNAQKVSEYHSIIYYIIIFVPTEWCKESQSKKKDIIYHAFAIEQFFDCEIQEVAYRMYQSWKNESTISEDMVKRGYHHSQAKWQWNEKEMKQFLTNLGNSICHKKLSREEMAQFRQKAFGYHAINFPLYEFKENTMIGLSFRYVSDCINPNAIQTNIKNLSESVIQEIFLFNS